MKLPRVTMVSLGAAAGACFAVICAAWPSDSSSRPPPSTPGAAELPLATSQRGVAVAQVTQSPAPEPADYSALRRQEFANLGQLLNAGGKLLSTQQFKEELVQRRHAGMLPSGAVVDVMYASSGVIAGNLISGGSRQADARTGSERSRGSPQNWPVAGSWTIDDSERICASIEIYTSQGASIIPKRCQFWFKFGDKYYVSDSDEDRSAKILVRELKQ